MRLGLFAVALILIAAPASAQKAPPDEGVTTGDSKKDDSKRDDYKKDESKRAEAQNRDASAPDDALSLLRRQRNKLKELGSDFKLLEQSEVGGDLTGGG